MKRLFFGIALTLAFANQAQAATLLLKGEVAPNCVLNSVSTAPFGNNNITLPIVSGTASTSVAESSVTCNTLAGYSIEATSANGLSRLAHTGAPSSYYTDYQLEITGTGSTGFQSLSSTPTALKTTSLSAPVTNQASTINVKVQPISTPAVAGTYEDTVTITLTAL